MTAQIVNTSSFESHTADHVGGGRPLMMVATVGLVVVATAYLFFNQRWRSYSLKLNGRPPLPPGSLGLPFIGETLELLYHRRKNALLSSFFEPRTKKYGPVFKTSIFGFPTVVMDVPDGNKFLFVNQGKLVESTYPKALGMLMGTNNILWKVGEDHRVERRLLVAFLRPNTMVGHLSRIEQTVIHHLAIWQEKKELSARKFVKLFTFSAIADLCISLKDGSELDELMGIFGHWGDGLMSFPISLPGLSLRRALKARDTLLVLLEKFIARRRLELKEGLTTSSQDMVSYLLTQPDDRGHFRTDSEIKDIILTMMFAGFDTTSSVLTLAIRSIAKCPHVHIRLKEEHDAITATKQEGEPLTMEDVRNMKYSWRVVQETMRLHNVTDFGFRKATTDFEYGGYTIPKGWKVIWQSTASHLNPKIFKNPFDFDPSRFEGDGPLPYTYLPFGGGPTQCLGMEFAKMEMIVFLHHFVRRFEWSLVDPDEQLIAPGLLVEGSKGTPIKLWPRGTK